MKEVYVYVESKQSLAFQFINFKTKEQADLFVEKLSLNSNTLRASVWTK